MSKKQIVVIGLKDRNIRVVICSTGITWMIATKEGLTKTLTHFRTNIELFKYILEQLNKTKQYVKMTSAERYQQERVLWLLLHRYFTFAVKNWLSY